MKYLINLSRNSTSRNIIKIDFRLNINKFTYLSLELARHLWKTNELQ